MEKQCQPFAKSFTWVGYRVWEIGHQNAAFVLEFVIVGRLKSWLPLMRWRDFHFSLLEGRG